LACPEDGTATESEGVVFADGETCVVQAGVLERVVELELMVGNDVAGASSLVGKDTISELDDWLSVANDVSLFHVADLFQVTLGCRG